MKDFGACSQYQIQDTQRTDDARPVHSIIIIIIIIIIIEWLVRYWTLPFLRACSRLDDSALDDRRLPDTLTEWC